MRHTLILLAVLLLAPLAVRAVDSRPAQRPSIVYLFTDQQPWYPWGLGGVPEIKTPKLDRLARAGAYFNNALANTPSHGGIVDRFGTDSRSHVSNRVYARR